MSLFESILLAIVQAITEFLPISSTAHLILFPWLFGWPPSGLTYNIAVHAGTLAGMVAYFYRDWLRMFSAASFQPRWHGGTEAECAQDRRLFWYIVAGTVPAAIAGLALKDVIETVFHSPEAHGAAEALAGTEPDSPLLGIALMAGMLIAFGFVLWWADRRGRQERDVDSVTLADALLIGAAQAVALIPGVSRSGVTITVGMFRGLTRAGAARFTFLLATPVIAGASLLELVVLLRRPEPVDWPVLGVGAAVSAVASYLVIAFLLRYLQTHTLRFFVYYRVAFGIFILLLVFLQSGNAR
jgi:undecaprenyl-diphosphatase